MGFFKSLFGGADEAPTEEEKKQAEARNFDLLKYDGVKAMRIRQYDYAVKCFQEALKLQDDMEVHDYLSQAYVQTGNLHAAIGELQVMADAQPDNVSVCQQMAHIAYMEEDYVLMNECCQRGLAIDPDNVMLHYKLAQASVAQGELINAVAQLTKTIALDEDMGDARLLRAQVLLNMGDTASAQEDADWLMERVPDHEDVLLLKARIAHAQGNDEEAIRLYDAVNDVNPFQLDAFRERGRIKLEQGDKQGAEEEMKKLLEINPDELAEVNGEYKAEGVEEMMKRNNQSFINPLGL